MDTVTCGDVSGTALPRSLVCGAETLGVVASRDTHTTPTTVRFQAREIQATWKSLTDLLKVNDERAKVHGTSSALPGFIYTNMPETALRYIQEYCAFVQVGNVQSVPSHGRPPEFSEDFRETSVALSQTIYWANYLFLMRGGPVPRTIAELETEFRQKLPVGDIISILSHIEFIFHHSKPIQLFSRSVL